MIAQRSIPASRQPAPILWPERLRLAAASGAERPGGDGVGVLCAAAAADAFGNVFDQRLGPEQTARRRRAFCGSTPCNERTRLQRRAAASIVLRTIGPRLPYRREPMRVGGGEGRRAVRLHSLLGLIVGRNLLYFARPYQTHRNAPCGERFIFFVEQ